MTATRLKARLRRKLRRSRDPHPASVGFAVVVFALGCAAFYMCCEREVLADSVAGRRSVGKRIDLERDSATIEPLALAQDQQPVSGDPPRRGPPLPRELHEQRGCTRLPIDQVEIDVVG